MILVHLWIILACPILTRFQQGLPYLIPTHLVVQLEPYIWLHFANIDLRKELQFSRSPVTQLQFLEKESA